jgi:Flp pilus assembly protein TadD
MSATLRPWSENGVAGRRWPGAGLAPTTHRDRSLVTGHRSRLVLATLIVGVAVVPYLNSVPNGFTFDDPQLIRDNPMVTGDPPLDLFRTVYNPGALYRPLTMLTYVANHRIDPAPWGYHIVNVALHALASLLVLELGLALLRSPLGAAIAAALFAVHPLHSEAVSSIVGRAELLAAVLALGAVLAFLRAVRSSGWRGAAWHAASLAAFATALLSKESAFTAIGLIVAVAWWTLPQARATRLLAIAAPYALVGAAYLGLRLLVVGSLALPAPPPLLDNPLAHVPLAARLATAVVVLFEYLSQLLVPLHLSADYSFNEIAAVSAVSDPRFLLAAGGLAVLALAVALGARHSSALGLAAAFAVIPLALTANLLFPIGTIKAERLLYLPSVGWCLAFGWLAAGAARRQPRAVALGVTALLIAYGARTRVRNADWKDNFTLFRSAVHTSPNSAKAHYNLGIAYDERGDTDSAMLHLRQALAIYPECAEAAFAIGAIYEHKGIEAGALHWYARTMQLDWSVARAHLNTGALRLRHGAYTGAEAAFRAGLAVDGANPRLLLGLALALRAQGRAIEARMLLDTIDPARLVDPRVREQFEQARLSDTGASVSEVVDWSREGTPAPGRRSVRDD